MKARRWVPLGAALSFGLRDRKDKLEGLIRPLRAYKAPKGLISQGKTEGGNYLEGWAEDPCQGSRGLSEASLYGDSSYKLALARTLEPWQGSFAHPST